MHLHGKIQTGSKINKGDKVIIQAIEQEGKLVKANDYISVGHVGVVREVGEENGLPWLYVDFNKTKVRDQSSVWFLGAGCDFNVTVDLLQ